MLRRYGEIYYFNEMGVLMYGEYMLDEEDITSKYYDFLNNPDITSSIKTTINHIVCYLFYQTKSNPDECKNKIINRIFLSEFSKD